MKNVNIHQQDNQTTSQQPVHESINNVDGEQQNVADVGADDEANPEKEICNKRELSVSTSIELREDDAERSIRDHATSVFPDNEEQPNFTQENTSSSGLEPNDEQHPKLESEFQSQSEVEQQAIALPLSQKDGLVVPEEGFFPNPQGGDGDLSDAIKNNWNDNSSDSRLIEKCSSMGSTEAMFRVSKILSKTKAETWSPAGIVFKESSSYQVNSLCLILFLSSIFHAMIVDSLTN